MNWIEVAVPIFTSLIAIVFALGAISLSHTKRKDLSPEEIWAMVMTENGTAFGRQNSFLELDPVLIKVPRNYFMVPKGPLP